LVKDLTGYLQADVSPLIMLSSKKKQDPGGKLKASNLPVRFVEKGSLLLPGAISVFTGETAGGFYFWEAKWLLLTKRYFWYAKTSSPN